MCSRPRIQKPLWGCINSGCRRGESVKRFAAIFSLAVLLASTASTPSPALGEGAGSVMVPGFWDPRRRPERPDLSRITVIRFLTEVDYPPFNYAGPDGNPAGFNVDLARLICEEIKASCTVQMRRFDTLLDALAA